VAVRDGVGVSVGVAVALASGARGVGVRLGDGEVECVALAGGREVKMARGCEDGLAVEDAGAGGALCMLVAVAAQPLNNPASKVNPTPAWTSQ
jgi:hypothetical protein